MPLTTPTDPRLVFATKNEIFETIFSDIDNYVTKDSIQDIKEKIGASHRVTLSAIDPKEWEAFWQNSAPQLSDSIKNVLDKKVYERSKEEHKCLYELGVEISGFLYNLLPKLFVFKDHDEMINCLPDPEFKEGWINVYIKLYQTRSNIKDFVTKCRNVFQLERIKRDIINEEMRRDDKRSSQLRNAENAPFDPVAMQVAFNEKFIDRGHYNLFCENLIWVASEFYQSHGDDGKSGEYLAPYIAMVQSSGVGKTRLNAEYLKNNFGFYICSRQKESTGYPARSAYADYLKIPYKTMISLFDRQTHPGLINVNMYVTYYLCFIAACLSILTDWINGPMDFDETKGTKTPEAWLKLQMKHNESTSHIESVWKHILDRHAQFLVICTDIQIYKMLDLSNMRTRDALWVTATYLLNFICGKYSECLNEKYPELIMPTLFVKDEARAYLECVKHDDFDEERSFFHYMRLSEYFFPRELKNAARITLSVLDTFGTVANFVPSELPDPSLRIIKANKIFPPFLYFGWQIKPLSNPKTAELQQVNLLNTGRFLWNSYKSVNTALAVAKLKLLGVTSVSDVECSTEQSLAILGARSALSFHAEEKISYQLLQSHAATLYYITPDRSRLVVGFPSEPMLAFASSSLLNDHQNISWKKCLEKLNNCLQTGVVQAGERGEIAGRIIFLMAMDRERNQMTASGSTFKLNAKFNKQIAGVSTVSVINLLTRMFGENLLKNLDTKYAHLLDGNVNFTHFEYVSYTPKLSHLKRFYQCMAAVSCKRNQEMIDLIIPAYLESQNMIYTIFVQIKLHEKGAGFVSVPEDMAFDLDIAGESGIPCIYILMQLGQGAKSEYIDTAVSLHRNENGKLSQIPENPQEFVGILIGSFGLSKQLFPFVQDDEVEVLKHIATAWVDPVKLHLQNKTGINQRTCAEIVKGSLMLQYKDFAEWQELDEGKIMTQPPSKRQKTTE